jgi:hypothetical protein
MPDLGIQQRRRERGRRRARATRRTTLRRSRSSARTASVLATRCTSSSSRRCDDIFSRLYGGCMVVLKMSSSQDIDPDVEVIAQTEEPG